MFRFCLPAAIAPGRTADLRDMAVARTILFNEQEATSKSPMPNGSSTAQLSSRNRELSINR